MSASYSPVLEYSEDMSYNVENAVFAAICLKMQT